MALIKKKQYNMFRKSKPIGYDFESVEAAIAKYEESLKQVNENYASQLQINNQLKQRINRLQDELKEMHIQMSCLEMPDVEEVVENYVLDDFKRYNSKEEDNAIHRSEPSLKSDSSESNSIYGGAYKDEGDGESIYSNAQHHEESKGNIVGIKLNSKSHETKKKESDDEPEDILSDGTQY